MIDPALCWANRGKRGSILLFAPEASVGNLVAIGLIDERKGKEHGVWKAG